MNVENNRGASSADEPWDIHTSAVLIPYHSTAASRLVEVTVRALALAGIPVAAHGVSSSSSSRMKIPDGTSIRSLYMPSPTAASLLEFGSGYYRPSENTRVYLDKAAAASPTKVATTLDFSETPGQPKLVEAKLSLAERWAATKAFGRQWS